MISSTLQRLLWKTCGLFDTGFAGDNLDVTGPGLYLNAPAVDSQCNFGFDSSSTSLNGPQEVKNDLENTFVQASTDNWMDELEDLSMDPLGDDSMETFVNLDQFLNGNSFFDDDNLALLNEDDVASEVTPVIDLGQPLGDTTFNRGNLTTPEANIHDFLLLPEEQLEQIESKSQNSSFKQPAQKGIVTSLYEIPVSIEAAAVVHTSTISDTELDHDYSSKRQRMSIPSEVNDKPSTSNSELTKRFSRPSNIYLKAAIPTTVSTPSDNMFLDNNMDKQTIRRIKNNYASKRSREQRKQKLSEMDVEAEELEVRNQKLRQKIIELEKLAKVMKAALVAKMAGK